MQRGYIKLWRKISDSKVFQNEGLLKIWIWCLIRANHKEVWVPIKTGKGISEVYLKPGQFVFGRHSAAKQLGMNPSTIWKRMKKLERWEKLNIQSNNQYSIISIINWVPYQTEQKKSNSKSNRQVTTGDTDNNDENDEIKMSAGAGFNDFSSKNLKKFNREINMACERIEKKSATKNRKFNAYQWVNDQVNRKRHPGAILETLQALIEYWSDINAPWGYAETIMKTKNQNWNERDHIEESQKFKEIRDVDPRIENLAKTISN